MPGQSADHSGAGDPPYQPRLLGGRTSGRQERDKCASSTSECIQQEDAASHAPAPKAATGRRCFCQLLYSDAVCGTQCAQLVGGFRAA